MPPRNSSADSTLSGTPFRLRPSVILTLRQRLVARGPDHLAHRPLYRPYLLFVQLHVLIVVSLLVILVAITVSIAASLIATRGGRSGRGDAEPDEADTSSDREDASSDRELELAGRPAGRTR